MRAGARSEMVLLEIEKGLRSADRLGVGPGSMAFVEQARETLLPLLAEELISEVVMGLEPVGGANVIAWARRWRLAPVDRPIFPFWPTRPVTPPQGMYVLRIRPSARWWSGKTSSERRQLAERLPLEIRTGMRDEVQLTLRLAERLIAVDSVPLPGGDFLVAEAPGMPLGPDR